MSGNFFNFVSPKHRSFAGADFNALFLSMILADHISHLLWSEGSVALAGIGVFYTARREALVEEGSFIPPHTDFGCHFGACVTSESLIESVARVEGIGLSEAAVLVDRHAEDVRLALESNGEYILDGVGTLRCDNNGAFSFISESSPSWLPVLDIAPLDVRRPAPEAVDRAAEALAARRDSLARSLRRTASSAAVITIVALVAFIASQLPGRRGSQPQVASIGIESIAPVVESPLPPMPGASEPALVLILNTPSDGTAPAKQRRRSEPIAAPQPDRYCLVVASLASRSEAETFIARHSTDSLPLSLLAVDGRWRVFAMSAPAADALLAEAHARDIYSRYPTAWICRR